GFGFSIGDWRSRQGSLARYNLESQVACRMPQDSATCDMRHATNGKAQTGEEKPCLSRRQSKMDWLPHAWLLGVLLFLCAGAAGAALSLVRVAPLYRTTDFYRTLGRRVDLALPAGARVGVIAPAVSEILYYGGRQGWRLDPGVIVPGGLASLRPDLGVRYLLI